MTEDDKQGTSRICIGSSEAQQQSCEQADGEAHRQAGFGVTKGRARTAPIRWVVNGQDGYGGNATGFPVTGPRGADAPGETATRTDTNTRWNL